MESIEKSSLQILKFRESLKGLNKFQGKNLISWCIKNNIPKKSLSRNETTIYIRENYFNKNLENKSYKLINSYEKYYEFNDNSSYYQFIQDKFIEDAKNSSILNLSNFEIIK